MVKMVKYQWKKTLEIHGINMVNNNYNLTPSKYYQNQKLKNNIFFYAVVTIFIFGLMTLLATILYIFSYSWPAISKVNFFGIVFDSSKGEFGILGLIIGTLFTTLLALIIATPIALFVSVAVISYLPKKIHTPFKIALEIFSGLPSIIFGLLALLLLVKIIPLSFTLAGVVLAVMIIPLIATYVTLSLIAFPKKHEENSYALGATKLETIFKLKIKTIRKGILTGFLLGLSRAIGETMAVTMVIGGSSTFPNFGKIIDGFFLRSGSTLTVQIVTQFLEAKGILVNVLFWLGFVLFLIVAVIISGVFYLLNKTDKKFK